MQAKSALAALAGWASVAVLGCGGPKDLGAKGTECYRAEDCAPGYVCLEGRCTDDLSSAVRQEDAPSDGAGAGKMGDASATETSVDDAPGGNNVDVSSGTGGSSGTDAAGSGGSQGTGGSGTPDGASAVPETGPADDAAGE